MASNEYRRPSNAPLWIMAVFTAIALAAFLWTIRMDLPQAPTILIATPAPQAPVKPGSGVITGITLPTRAAVNAPMIAPVVVPTQYTQADAEATSVAAYNAAVQQAELNAAPLPNAQKEVIAPADAPTGINADWCRGAHLDDPECQPGNGSKVEK